MVINDNDDDDDVDDNDSDFCWFFIVYSETCPEELKATVIWWFLLFSHSLLRKHASCPEELKAFTQGLWP